MSNLSRRKLITTGIVAAAGVSGLASPQVSPKGMGLFRPITVESTVLERR